MNGPGFTGGHGQPEAHAGLRAARRYNTKTNDDEVVLVQLGFFCRLESLITDCPIAAQATESEQSGLSLLHVPDDLRTLIAQLHRMLNYVCALCAVLCTDVG